MSGNLAALLLAATFITYLGPNVPDRRIEAIVDRGPIIELIIRCSVGTAIITYSKPEALYCGPSGACGGNRDQVIRRACGT